MEISARLAEENEEFDETEYHAFSTEMGKVYLPTRGVRYTDELTLGLVKFLWMPRITVKGIHA